MVFRVNYRWSGRYFPFFTRPGFNYKRINVSRKFNRRPLGRGSIRFGGRSDRGLFDETFQNGSWISNGDCWADYITFPSLGQGFGCRTGHSIRVSSINLDGTCRVLSGISEGVAMQTDTLEPVASTSQSCIIGVLSIFIVQDHHPLSSEKPSSKTVFGTVIGTNGYKADLHVRPCGLKRFKVLVREKIVLNELFPTKIVPLRRFIGFLSNNKLVTTFRDSVVATGTYANMDENGLMLYVLWESPVKSVVSFTINSRMSFVNQ